MQSILFTVMAVVLTSCVTPPSDLGPSVLRANELDYLARVNRGRELVVKRKLDVAEQEFRQAIRINGDAASAYNDLGYVLLEQGRLAEAVVNFKRAVALDELSIGPRENLARAYYRWGELNLALNTYRELLDTNFLVSSLSPDHGFLSDDGLRSVYRNISLTLYMRGDEDEALCYSGLASSDLNDMTEAGEHSRLLLSLGLFREAFLFQGRLVGRYGVFRIPPPIVLDYAVNSEQLGERVLSRDLAWTLIRARSGGRNVLASTIATFRLAGAWQDSEHQDRLVEVREMIQSDLDICSAEILPANYLPAGWMDRAKTALKEVCDSEGQLGS